MQPARRFHGAAAIPAIAIVDAHFLTAQDAPGPFPPAAVCSALTAEPRDALPDPTTTVRRQAEAEVDRDMLPGAAFECR